VLGMRFSGRSNLHTPRNCNFPNILFFQGIRFFSILRSVLVNVLQKIWDLHLISESNGVATTFWKQHATNYCT